MSGYIGDISPIYRVSRGVDTIFRGEKLEGRYFRKYRQNIGDISVRGDMSEINRPFFCDISPPSCNVIWWPRCDSNGNMAIQWPKLIFNGKLMFQRLFWPKFHLFHPFLLSFFICSLITPIFIKIAQLFNHFKVYLF